MLKPAGARLVARVFTALAAAFSVAVVGAAPAAADLAPSDDLAVRPVVEQPGIEQPLGNCTLFLCGEIKHHENSAKPYLGITDNWPPEFGNVAYIYRGKSSTDYFRDTDGFLVPSGCVGRSGSLWYGAGWHKIFDFNKLTIRIEC